MEMLEEPDPTTGSPTTTDVKEKVSLRLNVKFTDWNGNPVKSDFTDALIAKAEKRWTPTLDEYSVTANFTDPTARLIMVTLISGSGESKVPTVGQFGARRDTMLLFTEGYVNGGEATPYTPQLLNNVFAHELGHSLGAGEQYNKQTNIPFPGHYLDIMGTIGDSAAMPLGSTVLEIMQWRKKTGVDR